jgi:hypothetical protein
MSVALHQDAAQITAQLCASLDANPAVRTAAEAALQQAALMPGALAELALTRGRRRR